MHYFTWKLKLLLGDFAVKIYRRSFIYSKQKILQFCNCKYYFSTRKYLFVIKYDFQ